MPRSLLFVALLLLVSCRTVAPVLPGASLPPGYNLKVAIYPVANAQTIAARIQSEFQQQFPQYTVTVTVADMDQLYEPATLAGWLANGNYDLVEADMLLLEAVRQNLQQSNKQLPVWLLPPYLGDWLPAARAASMVGLDIYGVPHYGCGYFLFTTDPTLNKITNSTAFFAALDGVEPKKKYLTAMNVNGGSTTGGIYLNAWSMRFGNLTGAMNPPYNNPPVIAAMKGITTACRLNQTGTVSPCLDGTFKNNVDRQTYINGDANTFIGFSESLQPIRAAATPQTQFYVSAAPLGAGLASLLYTDSLLKRVGCSAPDPCAAAANAFAEYYLKPSTYQWLLLGQDIPGNTLPRYLIPATNSAWPAGDPYYAQIRAAVGKPQPFPNATFYGVRKQMQTAIMPQIMP